MTTVTQNTRNEADTVAPTLMIIGGHARDSANGTFIDVENPANRTIVGRVPRAGDADVDAAVRAAASAFEQWRAVAPRDRGRALVQIADALEADLESVARTVALETGNAIRTQARPEVKGAADVFRYFGGLASELKGETIPLGEHVLSYTRREPIGVVGAIVPWNAPVVLGALKIAHGRGRRQHAGAQGRRGRAARRCCGWRRSAVAICLQASSICSPATARNAAPRSRAILWSASCPSPDRPKSARSSCTPPRTASCPCHWSLAARAPPSSFRMPTTTARWTA